MALYDACFGRKVLKFVCCIAFCSLYSFKSYSPVFMKNTISLVWLSELYVMAEGGIEEL